MIRIQGDGVAARVSAHLLSDAGLRATQQTDQRPRLPVLMLPQASVRMLEEIAGVHYTQTHAIHRRVVRWGKEETRGFDHSAIAISEEGLLARLPAPSGEAGNSQWDILCARPLPDGVKRHDAGSRSATVARVRLQKGVDRHTCWIESLAEGWLFLIPAGEAAWLISVGATDPGTLVRAQIDGDDGEGSEFDAHPAVHWPLAGSGWLAAGSAALRFDPLCGDGTGHAVREAMLASAVVRRALHGEDGPALQMHYQHRLLAGYRRHLAVTESFYAAGGHTPWWREQQRTIRAAIARCDSMLEGVEFRYRLNGLELEPIR